MQLPIPQQFRYANENSFTFTGKDLSFNTTPVITGKGVGGITTASFNIDLDTTLSGWNKSTNFQTNFPHGIALPEHIIDVDDASRAPRQKNSSHRNLKSVKTENKSCLLNTSPIPRDLSTDRMPCYA